MTTITEQIIDVQRAEKRAAWATYRELVKRFHKPHETDGETMLDLCGLLGLTMEDIEGDARALQQMPTLREHAFKADELGKTSLKLGHEVSAKRAEQKEVIRKVEQELRTLLQRQASAVQDCQLARDAGTRVDQLAEQCWRIFQAPKPPLPNQQNLSGTDWVTATERWLADEPEKVFHAYTGNTTVVSILEQRGYVRDGAPNVWALKRDDRDE